MRSAGTLLAASGATLMISSALISCAADSGTSSGDGGSVDRAGSGSCSHPLSSGGTFVSASGAAPSGGASGSSSEGGVFGIPSFAGGPSGGTSNASGGAGAGDKAGSAGLAGSNASAGGAGVSGSAGATGTHGPSFYLGADVSFEESSSETMRAKLLELLKSHGFNSIRLRTFVDPKASDGYDKTNGFDDIQHTIEFGKQIKAAGLALLVDFHYSDNWADPGKQCVPIAWQGYTTITQLATAVHDYTKDAITRLIAGGARPDMVQVGNETTPGMLIHRCDASGSPTGNNPVTGSTSNWANLGALLKAGVDGVKEVDPKILVSFHIAKGGDHTDGKAALAASVSWLTNALKYTPVDAFGESCYQTYQGDASSASKSKAIWETTEGGLASKFPNVKIFAAEYGGAEREINDVIYNLPNQQGLGTFYWEPTVQGDWNKGHVLLNKSGSTYGAQPDLALYDEMKTAYQSRL